MEEENKDNFQQRLNNLQVYLTEAADFLAEHSWIYSSKNVDIFTKDTLQNIPTEWEEVLTSLSMDDIREIPYNYVKKEWPPSFKEFLSNVHRLSTFRYEQQCIPESVEHIKIPDFLNKNTPFKKKNEILWMAATVENVLQKHNCSVVLDIGCGLGYLDQILHHNYGVTTIGLESVESISIKANSRLQEGCVTNMHYINCTVEDNEESVEVIRTKLNEVSSQFVECCCGISKCYKNSSKLKVMMISLHSCGELAQNMMKLFLKIPEIDVFFCVGCCYHFIPLDEFPVSSRSKEALSIVSGKHPCWTPSATGLRLACQYTREHWKKMSDKEHCQQEISLLYRAALEKFLLQEGLTWNKPRRRIRKETITSALDEFVSFAFQDCTWPDMEQKVQGFKQMCKDLQKHRPCIQLLHLLQTLLQPIWEGFIIADRLAFLLENNISAKTFAMCDELLSPRNVVLFGVK